ncbi:hypothetical protein [Phormidium sp. FACHB-1136]|uniref:hypothetical protein n=1 Tax=Phormidium sp. FACHB-1136 TaxID=2692848 RepID=UPI001683BF10|nr:hypothetical protein [Phormidium sp. FACHB-1136]MBD2428481.1 hypothetical protein [Phormidium sp. FACHB-1136]
MPWPLPLLAQVPPASQIDLLTQQIEFLQDANSRMADSFGQFVTLVNVAITLVVAFIGILGFSTRREIKQSLDGLVRAEVKKQLANTVKAQVEDLERIILREALVGQTQVDYLLPISPSPTPTAEYQLLKARGFQMAWMPYDPERRYGNSHVLILDLLTPDLAPERQEALITDLGQRLQHLTRPPVLVIYVRGQSQAITDLPKALYYIPVNSRGTLLGAVTDAAQIAYALRQPTT